MANKPNKDAPLLMFNESAIARAELRRDPYDFVFIENAIDPKLKKEVLADAPVIPDRGSYGLPSLRYGPKFDACMQDLLSPRFRHLVEQKFDMDLSPYPASIVMMGNTTGVTTKATRIPTQNIRSSPSLWDSAKNGRMNAAACASCAATTAMITLSNLRPEFGKILMFRVCDHSWHGFLPQKGKRMSVQLCYVDSKWYPIRENVRHAISAFVKSIPGAKQIIDWAPRSWGNKG